MRTFSTIRRTRAKLKVPLRRQAQTGPIPIDIPSYTSASGDRQSPSPAARELCDRLRFQLISETLDLISSYATSGAEAAWRGDRAMLELHLKQTRLSLLTAIETFKALGASFNTNTGEAA